MSSEVVAEQAISLLRKLSDDALPGPVEQALRDLAELVEDGLTEAGAEGLPQGLGGNSDEQAAVEALSAELDRDAFLRAAVARSVDTVLRAVKTPVVATPVIRRDANGAVVHDLPADAVDTTAAFVRSEAAGAALWIVSTAVTIGLAFGGYHAYRSFTDWANAGFMGEGTRCSEFVAAHRAVQQEVLKQLYAEAGKYGRAGDPFIELEVAFMCGQSPDATLGEIVARTR
jgi:hypothetical protein